MEGGSPTIRRRRLGRALRELRERAGMTGSKAGAAVERSGSWISRVEGGRVGLRVRDLRDLLDLYDVRDAGRREELEALAREGKQRGWWSQYSEELPDPLAVYIGLEDAAEAIHGYQDRVVPGLLQTEHYCRAVMRQGITGGSLPTAEFEALVQVRMARQAHVDRDPPPQLRFVIDESVLYRTIGGSEVLGEQLDHLSVAAQAPRIDLRVIPFARGDRVDPAGAFTVLSFPHDPDVVWLDNPFGMTHVDEDEAVEVYHRIYAQLAAAALDPEDTSRLIREAKGRLR